MLIFDKYKKKDAKKSSIVLYWHPIKDYEFLTKIRLYLTHFLSQGISELFLWRYSLHHSMP